MGRKKDCNEGCQTAKNMKLDKMKPTRAEKRTMPRGRQHRVNEARRGIAELKSVPVVPELAL